jgi:hypothetical protein
MKKWLNFAIMIVFVLGITLIVAPQRAQAIPIPSSTPAPLVWQYGPGVTGTPFAIDLTTMPAPNWLQLASTGLKLSGPSKICYPFRDGQFHWVGEIREFVGGKWVKLDTTVARPNVEADDQACAQALEAGTYALFAYYNGPATEAFNCSDLVWGDYGFYEHTDGDTQIIWQIEDAVAPVPDGTPVTYITLNQNPTGTYNGDLTGSTVMSGGVATFTSFITFSNTINSSILFRFSVNGCTHDIPFDYSPI